MRAASTGAASPGTYGSADTQYANFAFASEIGSGVYEISGSVITVYTFQPYYPLRGAQPNGGRPGIRLIFPFTVGFFNFDTNDLLHLHLPSSIGAVSFEPGVELDYWMNDAWDLYPYVKAGGTAASSSDVNAVIWGAGIRSDYRFEALAGAGLWRSQFSYAGAYYHGDVPNESFTRLRNGAELRRNLDLTWHSRALQLSPYGIVDVYFNAPSGPASGIAPRTFQYELGLMIGVSPQWQVWGWSLPRLGVGWREAGVLSGWRLVLGDPF
ncbi:MAG: hypothetical protein JO203_06125 [Gammaproteobacteria bacterium]|nr:hypothetical protein [Gammaproteobacteria bacterium]